MFYSEAILSRRGALGRVWLAAHMERKLSKSQTLQTDIEKSVDAIMGQEIELMALRLSGQLLLGVVRIYSRKAKYLLDDCNEALLKIKMAFRPGVVDLTEEQLTVNKTTITLQTNGVVLDLLMPDIDWDMDFEDRPIQRQGHHQAHVDDITLRIADDFQLGARDAFEIGPSDGIESNDFNGIDIDFDWGGEAIGQSGQGSVDGSVGVGRDAPIGLDSMGPDIAFSEHGFGPEFDALSYRSKSREASAPPFDLPMDIDLPEAGDFNLEDIGIGFDDIPPLDEREKTPGQTRSSSRASSPLTELPATPPPLDLVDPIVNLEPGTAEKPEKAKRKPKDKKQIIDSVTELQTEAANNRGRAANLANPLNTDTTIITTKQQFLPRSSVVIRLLEIREDPVGYFLSSKGGSGFSSAPPGLIPELAELFTRSAPVPAPSSKRRAAATEEISSKRSRIDEDIEVARRADSMAPSVGMNLDANQPPMDVTFEFDDQTGQMDDFELGIPEINQGVEARAKSVLSDRSRLSSVGPGGDFEDRVTDSSCPVAVFDSQPSQTQSSQAPDREEEIDIPENEKGYSKNTLKALNLIRRELQPSPENAPAKVLSFQQMTTKASRRAASSFFFELLVLGTRDCIHVNQPSSFSDINVGAKPRLWEQQQQHSNFDRASEPPII
ncbi:Rec8 like protein-domain-containing protein [Crepidotus variabilis]|uniref:Rec8 like protein-domain-containing protein n=1 Tax=Crepidotus variabilis TaxID=179855 RepID=A0A9P6EI45_9AGAR|nr:Rec8 like protein-domain-containing protein [Crepidotus variabilis]